MKFPFDLPFLPEGCSIALLESCGMKPGQCAEAWALAHPQLLREQSGQFLQAGASALLAPTFGANRAALAPFGLEGQAEALNAGLMALTKECAGKLPAGGRVGPSGLFPPPAGEADFDAIYHGYREQVRALARAGADFLLVEGQHSLADMRAALLAARSSGLPALVSLTVDEAGRTLSGAALLPCLITLQAMGAAAVGLDRTPLPVMEELLEEAAPHACVPLIARPSPTPGAAPEEFAAGVQRLAAAGALVLGAASGSAPAYTAALRAACPAPAPLPEKGDCWAAASEQEAFFLGDDIRFSEPVSCSPGLAEDLIALEDGHANAALVELETVDDAFLLAEQGPQARLPIAIHSHSLPVLEAALRYFQGRLILDSESPFEEEELTPLSVKYGAILY